jgi:hypothetical protein
MVLGREDTLNLLEPFSEIYQTARAALGAVLESEPSKKEGESEEGSALNLVGSAAQDTKAARRVAPRLGRVQGRGRGRG